MKFPGVRSVVTYALVGATIYAMAAGVPVEQSKEVTGMTLLALGFFFAKSGGSSASQ